MIIEKHNHVPTEPPRHKDGNQTSPKTTADLELLLTM